MDDRKGLQRTPANEKNAAIASDFVPVLTGEITSPVPHKPEGRKRPKILSLKV
jgi:hypothetical protein